MENIASLAARFRTHLRRDAYSGARYAFVAFERDGELHNMCSRVTWQPSKRSAPSIRAVGQRLVIASGWLTWKESLRLLDELPEGRGTMAEHQISFRNAGDGRPYAFSWEHAELMWSQPYIGWSAHCVGLHGLQIGSLLGDTRLGWLGDRLISLRPDRVMSWRDVERILGPKVEVSETRGCTIELFAPLYARLLEPSLVQNLGKLMIPIESYLDPVASGMELVAQEALGGTLIATVPANKWKRGKHRTWAVLLDSDHLRGSLDLSLNAGDFKIWRTTIALPGLAARLLDGIEDGHKWLERLLLPTMGPKVDSEGFERAVVSLLALGGIPTVPIGHDGPDRSSDFICAISAKHVILGECTVGPIAPKKVGDLRHRAAGVIRRLQRPGEDLDVVACVFTPSSEADLPPEHLSMAVESGIAVVWRERLDQLLGLARSGELGSTIFGLLEDWRPRRAYPLQSPRRRGLR